MLTSFVGVTGLVRRMAMDRCLPQVLLNENSCRKTNHWIIIGFFAVASSLFLVLSGNVETLSGVYNLAFLAVMVRGSSAGASDGRHAGRQGCGAGAARGCIDL